MAAISSPMSADAMCVRTPCRESILRSAYGTLLSTTAHESTVRSRELGQFWDSPVVTLRDIK